jgi:hypothetical protein
MLVGFSLPLNFPFGHLLYTIEELFLWRKMLNSDLHFICWLHHPGAGWQVVRRMASFALEKGAESLLCGLDATDGSSPDKFLTVRMSPQLGRLKQGKKLASPEAQTLAQNSCLKPQSFSTAASLPSLPFLRRNLWWILPRVITSKNSLADLAPADPAPADPVPRIPPRGSLLRGSRPADPAPADPAPRIPPPWIPPRGSRPADLAPADPASADPAPRIPPPQVPPPQIEGAVFAKPRYYNPNYNHSNRPADSAPADSTHADSSPLPYPAKTTSSLPWIFFVSA